MRRVLGTVRMALSALLVNRARSLLTTLGIIIGVASVILITSLGKGLQAQVGGQLNQLGPNIVTVLSGSGSSGGGPFDSATVSTLKPGDVQKIARLPSVKSVSASVSVAVPLNKGRSVAFTGVDPSYVRIRSVKLAAGHFLRGPKELVLSPSDAKRLLGVAPGRPKAALGKTLEMRGERYSVVGITNKAAATSAIGPSLPVTSYMTTGDALKLSGYKTVGQILALAKSRRAVGKAAMEITTRLKAAHGGVKDFSIGTEKQALKQFTQITNGLTAVLATIAGISLIVGGIGVMNIMLVSVAERTREIGVRKALGATDSDLLLQFLLEAVFLALIGGLIGIAVGVGISTSLSTFSHNLLPTRVTGSAVGLAFGVSALIGVVFGVLPAFRSARLQPVEALRRE